MEIRGQISIGSNSPQMSDEGHFTKLLLCKHMLHVDYLWEATSFLLIQSGFKTMPNPYANSTCVKNDKI